MSPEYALQHFYNIPLTNLLRGKGMPPLIPFESLHSTSSVWQLLLLERTMIEILKFEKSYPFSQLETDHRHSHRLHHLHGRKWPSLDRGRVCSSEAEIKDQSPFDYNVPLAQWRIRPNYRDRKTRWFAFGETSSPAYTIACESRDSDGIAHPGRRLIGLPSRLWITLYVSRTLSFLWLSREKAQRRDENIARIPSPSLTWKGPPFTILESNLTPDSISSTTLS